MPDGNRPAWTLRVAGTLAMLWGALGVLFGLVGAATFVPFAHDSTFNPALARGLTEIALVGMAISAAGVYAGWALRAGRGWGWTGCLAVAGAAVATFATMTVLVNAPWYTISANALVVGAYGVEVVLLLAGHGSLGSPRVRARPS
jgi:hypothetical protein